MSSRPYRVTVLVVGDLGRSPRMLNHALALAKNGAEVSLAGYRDSPIDAAVIDHPRIRVYPLARALSVPPDAGRLRFLISSGIRFLYLNFELSWLLLHRTPRPDALLFQNPPGVPALLMGWVSCRWRKSRFLVDWHNLGYSMLALRLGSDHFLVRFTKTWERKFGRKADAHYCVSQAMQSFLQKDFGLHQIAVLYDAPREFAPLIPPSARREQATALLQSHGISLTQSTALLLSPTSWSADEDMNMLLDGLMQWDRQSLFEMRLTVLITGQGPLRAQFENRLKEIQMGRVEIHTLFLDPAEYRRLLGLVDLGLCMHRSSSGLDLPMKLMDFLGARTPVLAFDYGPTLRERHSGPSFANAEDLAKQLDELLQNPPAPEPATETWFEEWHRIAAHRPLR